MGKCSNCGKEINSAHWKEEDFLLCLECFEKKLVEKLDKEKLDLLKECRKCNYNTFCFSVPNGSCQITRECKNCGWRLADPDPCEGCRDNNLFIRKNHQFDNEI